MTAALDFRVTVKNFDAIARKFEAQLGEACRLGLIEAGTQIVEELQAASEPFEDTGSFRLGWQLKEVKRRGRVGLTVQIVNSSPHAAATEFGRQAGKKMPPMAPIAEWAYRKGLVALDVSGSVGQRKSTKSLAFTGVDMSAGKRRPRARRQVRPYQEAREEGDWSDGTGATTPAGVRKQIFAIAKGIKDNGFGGKGLLNARGTTEDENGMTAKQRVKRFRDIVRNRVMKYIGRMGRGR